MKLRKWLGVRTVAKHLGWMASMHFSFKKNWVVIGEEVFTAVKALFENAKILKQFNATSLVIIPKVQNPDGLNDFRPIV